MKIISEISEDVDIDSRDGKSNRRGCLLMVIALVVFWGAVSYLIFR